MGTNTPIPPRGLKIRLKFAQICKACEPAVRLARKYARELVVAFVLAIVAAVLYEPCKDFLAERALQRASKAVAKLFIQDANGKRIGTASGVFISPDGLLVTNAHVATAAKGGQILAQLSTQALYEVKKTVGVNPAYDIAVLQFQASEVPFVPINKAIIAQAGEHVWAIGSPKGLEGSISEGVISRPQREIKGVDFIQFTAPISRGSSGGGLFNLNGRMLGITTSAVVEEGAQNLNFAVPVKYIDRASDGATEVGGESRIGYLLALFTGLRRAELKALTVADIKLDANVPSLSLDGRFTKNGKSVCIPLHPQIVTELRALIPADAKPSDPLLTGKMLPSMRKMKKDLKNAGIEYENDAGRADFHALRHTLATNLARWNVAPRVAMQILRHSDIRLTMNVYTDASQLPVMEAIGKLPAFSSSDITTSNTQTHPQVPDSCSDDQSLRGIEPAGLETSKVVYPEEFWHKKAAPDTQEQSEAKSCLARTRT